jgi:2-iminobutanoate/2-iminopropanoate deaminase
MEIVSTKNAPDAIGPYSQAVTVNGFVFTSGQIGIDPRSGQIEETGIEGQARQAILNLASILEAAGSGLEKAVKTTCFLQNMADFAAFNEVYARFFPNRPARSCVEVAALPKGALVEIEVIAELGK